MAAKIFYQEHRKVSDGERKPHFKLVAVAGIDMKLYDKRLRKSELKQIANKIDAELVLLRGDKKGGNDEDVSVND